MLRIEDLSIATGSTLLLKALSLSVAKGELLGVVGESGSGKSITGLSIIGLLNPNLITSGKIFLDETELLCLSEKERHRFRGTQIGMIFQEPMSALHPSITCGEQIAESLRYHFKFKSKAAKTEVYRLFDEVDLLDKDRIYNSYPHQISGGQRQRVMIALAISLNPSLIIADEPTTALDVTVQQNIVGLIKDITNKRNISTIFVSHDLPLVASIADNIAVLLKGEMVEYNTPSALYLDPKHPYTKALFHCKPSIQHPQNILLTVQDIFDGKTFGSYVNTPANTYTDVLFHIKGVHKAYTQPGKWFSKAKENTVLKNIDFEIFKGEVLGLVGESGSGKSTLAKLLLKLEPFKQGNIVFKGKSISDWSNFDYHKYVQIVFQDAYAALNPQIKIGDAMLEPLLIHQPKLSSKQGVKKVKDLLEKVGLAAEDYNKFPKAFSGGQRQRINIARSIIIQPEFLVLDESVAALDVSVQAQVLNLLHALKAEFNLTYLFITHDLSVVHHFCDRVVVLDKGEIVEMGMAKKLIENPSHPYTKRLVDAIPTFKAIAS